MKGQRVCSRCGSALTEQHGLRLAGVCGACLEMLLSSQGKERADFIESIPSPAALVDRDLAILSINSQFSRVFGSLTRYSIGPRIGEAVDCANPTSDSRCGETLHCFQCGIRRLVDVSRITGESIGRIHVTFRHKSGVDQAYVFTTEKTPDAVLLVIGT